jgi:hypothetical protein
MRHVWMSRVRFTTLQQSKRSLTKTTKCLDQFLQGCH